MTSKQIYQVSNEFDYRAMLENFSIAQLEAQILQHKQELQGNGEMAESARLGYEQGASEADYEHECEEIEAYLAIDREVLASKQAAAKEASEQPAKPAKKRARKASAKKVIIESGDSLASYAEILPNPEEPSEPAGISEADMAYYSQAVKNIEASLQPYEEIEEAAGAMDSAIEDLEDEIGALWGISIEAHSEQIQRALLNRLQSEAVMEAQEAREASQLLEASSLADSIPCYDAPIDDLQDEIAAFLALQKEQEAAAMHAENPLQAPSEEEMEWMAADASIANPIHFMRSQGEPSEEEIENMALAMQSSQEAAEAIRASEEQESEAMTAALDAIEAMQASEPSKADSDFADFEKKLAGIAESPAKKLASPKPAPKAIDAYGNEVIVKPGQTLYEGLCTMPEGFEVPSDRAILASKEKSGRMRYILCGRRADRPGAWIKYGEPNSWWYACSLIDLQKWIDEKAGIEPPCQKQPNIPAVKLGLIPEPAPKVKPAKVTLPAGDKSLKMADQRAMQAELNLLRHVNEINAFISFGILPEMGLEDEETFAVMQAFLDGEKIYLFGYNIGSLREKNPYYAIEASDSQLDAICEFFQIKRAK